MPIVDSPFRPAWWLRGDHAQTLYPTLFRRRPKIPIAWERLELDDGDFLDLAWSGRPGAPVVLLFHGLQGGLSSHYSTAIMDALARRGFRACLMHFRGCGRAPNRLPISYHSGKTDDAQRLMAALSGRGEYIHGAVGISLGGNMLLKWLGEQGERSPLRRAAAVSVPFRLADAADRLETGVSRVYQAHLVRSLRQAYRQKFARTPSPLKVDIDSLKTFRQFDDAVTAALHGFDGVNDYYTRCSSRRFLRSIRVETLILHARRDPFMYASTIPGLSELSSSVTLEISDRGGHVGFVAGVWPGLAHYYLERRIADWIAG